MRPGALKGPDVTETRVLTRICDAPRIPGLPGGRRDLDAVGSRRECPISGLFRSEMARNMRMA